MNAMRNKVQLIGRVGSDPQITELESGKKLAKFSIAINETYRDKNGERIEKTQWHNVIAWGSVAELISKYVTKGKEIGLEGKLQYNKYEDKGGQTRYFTEVVAHEVLLLGSKAA